MNKLFSLDSPVVRFLSRMADVMILNILVLITCIPIITIGASITAMHYVLIKMVRDEESYIIKMYFKSFKENFLQATILWLIIAVISGVFIGDYFVFVKSGHEFSIAFMVAVLVFFVLFLMTVMYVFPLQARFYNTVGRTMKNAFLMMILNFPKSILMFLLYLLPVVLLIVSPVATPFLIMFGVSGPGLGAAYLYRKVFARFEPESTITDDMDFTVDMEGVETAEVETADATAEVVETEVVETEDADTPDAEE